MRILYENNDGEARTATFDDSADLIASRFERMFERAQRQTFRARGERQKYERERERIAFTLERDNGRADTFIRARTAYILRNK